MSQRYFGEWTCLKDIEAYYPQCGLTDEQVLFACYDLEGCEGAARILFQRDGQLYENSDGHCSCNGLDTWEPELVTWVQLGMRREEIYWCGNAAAREAWLALIHAHTVRA